MINRAGGLSAASGCRCWLAPALFAGSNSAIRLGALALAMVTWPHAAYAAGLFIPLVEKASVTSAASSTDDSDGLRQRVRVAHRELAAARDDVRSGTPGRLLLNVTPRVTLDVAIERSAPTEWGYSLSGRIEGGQVGFVTFVVHEEVVAGTIWTPDAAYELTYLQRGVHALRDVTKATPLECAGALRSDLSAGMQNAQDGPDDGSVVDILVVWTPAAEEDAGGEPQVLSRIAMLVAYANDALERSGAYVSLNLVGAEEADYSETNRWTDLDRLIDPDDGHLDHVHDRQGVLGADLVYLVARHRGGRGQVLGSYSVGVGDERVFAHEVGHNMGLLHDRYEAGPETFAHGFVTEDASCEQTIMAYPNRCEDRGLAPFSFVPFYSSPWRYSPHTGRALGVPRHSNVRGPQGPADAVLAINRNRHRVANFRPNRSGG